MLNISLINNTNNMASPSSSSSPFENFSINLENNLSSNNADVIDNLTMIFGPKRDPLYIAIPITVIYGIIFITGVIGNISTCIVISKNKSMHTATNYYLFSLAISDFILLVSGLPMEVYYIWSHYPFIFGKVVCIARGMIAEMSSYATVLTITAFTVERYVAICHPFISHTMSKLSRAIKFIVVVWLVSIAFAIPQALQFGITTFHGVEQCQMVYEIITHSFELSTLIFFFAPMTLITVLYILIGLKLRSSTIVKRANGTTVQRRTYSTTSCRQQNGQGTRRVLKMLVAVVVAFFICWAPFHAQRLFALYGSNTGHNPSDEYMLNVYSIMTYISGILYYLSTSINPLLYNIMSNKFREAFKATLARCCHIPRRGYDKKRAYRVLSRSQRRNTGRQESTDCSGNSYRDESLHSSSTQKQSIDSISLMHQNPPSNIKFLSSMKANNESCYTHFDGRGASILLATPKSIKIDIGGGMMMMGCAPSGNGIGQQYKNFIDGPNNKNRHFMDVKKHSLPNIYQQHHLSQQQQQQQQKQLHYHIPTTLNPDEIDKRKKIDEVESRMKQSSFTTNNGDDDNYSNEHLVGDIIGDNQRGSSIDAENENQNIKLPQKNGNTINNSSSLSSINHHENHFLTKQLSLAKEHAQQQQHQQLQQPQQEKENELVDELNLYMEELKSRQT